MDVELLPTQQAKEHEYYTIRSVVQRLVELNTLIVIEEPSERSEDGKMILSSRVLSVRPNFIVK